MKYLVRQQNQAKSQSRRFKVTEVIFKDGTLRLWEHHFYRRLFLNPCFYMAVSMWFFFFFLQVKDMREEGLLYFTSYANEEIGLF